MQQMILNIIEMKLRDSCKWSERAYGRNVAELQDTFQQYVYLLLHSFMFDIYNVINKMIQLESL